MSRWVLIKDNPGRWQMRSVEAKKPLEMIFTVIVIIFPIREILVAYGSKGRGARADTASRRRARACEAENLLGILHKMTIDALLVSCM